MHFALAGAESVPLLPLPASSEGGDDQAPPLLLLMTVRDEAVSDCESELVLVAVNASPSAAPPQQGPRRCRLPAALLADGASVTCAALLAGEPASLMLCVGLSSGEFLVFRGVDDCIRPGRGGCFQVCGHHRLEATASPSMASPVAACGFAAWGGASERRQVALFAASASGAHRLWLTGGAGPGPAAYASEVEVPRPQPRPLPAPTPAPAGAALALRAAASAPWLAEPAPPACTLVALRPESDLERLIKRTAREIADLEGEEANLLADIEASRAEPHRPPPRPEQLVPLELPEAPLRMRLPREARVDARWATAQRELLDPAEISRAYLDRACCPSAKPGGPYWPSPWTAEELTSQRRRLQGRPHEAIMSDPLENHVRSLCALVA